MDSKSLRAAQAPLKQKYRDDPQATLGVDRAVPVGIQSIAVHFEIDGDLDDAERERLVASTERYCVVLATLRDSPALNVEILHSTGGA